MTIGPAPMIMMDLMSVRFGMIVTHFIESVMKARKNAVGIGQDVIIPEAQDTVAQLLKYAGSLIVLRLLRGMLPTIDLDDQALLEASKVDNIGSDRYLLPEAVAIDLASTQQ
ncbi:MAG TPA: hypothetical protein VN229_20705 [Terriglobales bacterium]|nr:hypothetical protein [Terriglobales bacterium]